MTSPVERVPLTDEHLLQLETLWLGPDGTGRAAEALTAAELASFGRIALEDVPGLLAELRASRARQQELRAEYDEATQELATELADERTLTQELQRRIDKTLAASAGLARIIKNFTSDGDARSTAGGASAVIAAVRAALTGTETTPDA